MKVDTNLIPDFDSLSDEQKTAIQGMTFPDEVDMSKFVAKETFDKKAKEASDYHKQLDARKTDAEKEKEATETAFKDMQDRLAAYERNEQITNLKIGFMSSLGMDEEMANETAIAQADGDMTKVFANQKKHMESLERAKKAADIASAKELPVGGGIKFDDKISQATDWQTKIALMRMAQEQK